MRVLALTLLFGAVLSLVACSGTENYDKPDAAPESGSSQFETGQSGGPDAAGGGTSNKVDEAATDQ
ncbi:MAG: hypothetical protein LCH41_03425 [Armatimonadetes bacterium]|nr:hypothetical protein [Armatimonadota bacterium]